MGKMLAYFLLMLQVKFTVSNLQKILNLHPPSQICIGISGGVMHIIIIRVVRYVFSEKKHTQKSMMSLVLFSCSFFFQQFPPDRPPSLSNQGQRNAILFTQQVVLVAEVHSRGGGVGVK